MRNTGNQKTDKKRQFKKLPYKILLGTVILALFLLTGCGASAAGKEKTGRLQVITTIFPQYDFVRQIAGGQADVRMLLKPGEEIHSYEPTPQDIRDIQNCDLFIYVGGENDAWVEEILESMGEEAPETLRLMDMVGVYSEETVEGMQEEKGAHEHGDAHEEEHAHENEEHGHENEEHGHEDEEHDHEEEADEHVWTSPVNAAVITARIAEAMEEKDPANAALYRENAEAYIGELKRLDDSFRRLTESAVRRTLVFGDRFPLRYFAEEYGLDYYAAFPGCSADCEPSAATMAFLINKVRQEQIPVVFCIEFSNGNIARAICETTGAVPMTFYSCHNVTADQMQAGVTYIDMMEDNLAVLEKALY